MTVDSVEQNAYARRLGVVDRHGRVVQLGLANLLRQPLARWGLSSRAAVVGYARQQLDAAGVRSQASELLPKILSRMVRLGECVEVVVDDSRYIVPSEPRWIRTAKDSGALLGVVNPPDGIEIEEVGGYTEDIVRRIKVRSDDDQTLLRVNGISEASFRDWLRPIEYLSYWDRRKDGIVRTESASLRGFWDLLVGQAGEYAETLSDEAEVRAVVGEVGSYFGRHDTDQCQGRWRHQPPEGCWCAYRRGYGSQHWHPTILIVDGRHRRTMDLHDNNEWRWALLARGYYTCRRERHSLANGIASMTFPAPDQLIAAMDILGSRQQGWTWRVAHTAPDPWEQIH